MGRLIAGILGIILCSSGVFSQEWVELFDKGANFYEIKEAFEKEWKDKDYIRGRGFKQYKRWEYFMEMRISPDGSLPASASLYNAWKKEKRASKSTRRSSLPTWESLGPASWNSSSYNPGLGRVNVIVEHPTDPNTIYVGVPAGGCWKSIDGGTTWENLTDTLPVLGVSGIAIDPDNNEHVFIATGDGDGADTYSIGVLESFNGGDSWSETGLTWDVNDFVRPRRLLIDPNDGDRLWLASSQGLHISTDGGDSWTLTQGGSMQDVELHPTNPDIVYACSDKFYRSTNGGSSFTQITSGVPDAGDINRFKIAVSPDEPNWVYMIGGDQGDSSFEGLYFSSDSGQSFETRATTPNIFAYDTNGNGDGGQSWYDMALAVDPSNADIVVAGGINVWISDDGGQDFDNNTYWIYPNNVGYVHADIHELVFFGDRLYCGSDGGAFLSSDLGNNWDDLSDGLVISQFYRMSGDPLDAQRITGGTQDNGTYRKEGSDWTHILGADGMETIIDYDNSDRIYACIQFGGLRRSNNNGNNFTGISSDIDGEGAWVTPYVIHPTEHNTLFAGYEDVWKTENAGNDWTMISDFGSSSTIRTLHVSPSDPDVIYAGTLFDLYRTENGGSNWVNIYDGLPNNARVTYMAIHDQNPDSIWVTLSGYNSNKVYFSANGGDDWSNFSEGLPSIPANTIVYQPNTSDLLYVGTDLGVYYRMQGASQWIPFNEGLPNVIIGELEIHLASSKLRAATFGRGIWEADLLSSTVFLDCTASSDISCGDMISSTTFNGNSDVDGYVCSSKNAGGPEIVYNLTVDNSDSLILTLSNLNGVDLDLYLLSACNENLCLAYGDDQIVFIPNPGEYKVVVEGANGESGTYDLSVECREVVCRQDIQATCGETYSDDTGQGGENIWGAYDCVNWDESGPEHVYTIEMTSSGDLTATLSNLDEDLDVFILSQCTIEACLAFGNNVAEANGISAGTYYVVVDGYEGAVGSYDLLIECPQGEASVSGLIQNEWGTPINNVNIVFTGDESFTVSTNSDGEYASNLQNGSSVTLTPGKNDMWRDGLTTLDLVHMQRHLVFLDTLDSPEKIIASDANQTGHVSVSDLVQLQQLIIFNIDSIPNGTSYRFVDADYVFPDPLDPWAEVFPEWADLNNVNSSEIQNFTAIKTGDVTGNGTGAAQSTFFDLTMDVRDENGFIFLDFRTTQSFDVTGFQFSFQFPVEKFLYEEITAVQSKIAPNFAIGTTHVTEGLIHLSTYQQEEDIHLSSDEILFSIKLKEVGVGFNRFTFNQSFLNPEIYLADGRDFPLKLIVSSNKNEEAEFMIYPNPGNAAIYAEVFIPQEGEIEFQLISIEGKLLGRQKKDLSRGVSTTELDFKTDISTGTYLIIMSWDNNQIFRKYIRTK